MTMADARAFGRPARRRWRAGAAWPGGGATASIGLGVLGALFFSSSFIANRLMAVGGGAWEWTASLRFLYSLPIFLLIVAVRGARTAPETGATTLSDAGAVRDAGVVPDGVRDAGLRPVFGALRAAPGRWTLWSTVCFGLFYAPLCFAATTSPGWMVAATWQVTIVCGVVLAPLLYGRGDERGRVPVRGLALSGLILAGVFLTQLGGGESMLTWKAALGVGAVLFGAVAYPVGNRRAMELAGDRLDTFQRLAAMSVASLPFWLLVAVVGGIRAGLPTGGQLTATAVVAVFSGVIATSLFFAATHRERSHPMRLAAVEATQAAEVVFVALLEPVLLHSSAPGAVGWGGIVAITVGVMLYALAGKR
ncbi:multidrug resistance efflux transporter family protein [Actinomadura logoneensis]|uniref:Multidrug resistance efflux transporter family protein n=2 Tax=Actinomadura logoneensis TaxID=2293572 RepID=A0A372JRL8_9ACTN|nr:multidrug resistance efflux transporter family protein [Actinomadura logoneensis]